MEGANELELAGLSTGVLVLLAALWSLLGPYLSTRSRYLNESGTACLLGLAAGVVLLACRSRANSALVDSLLHFNSAAFFTYLLPPVIFYAGLSVERRLFFSNLPSILSFGILGTLISFILTSAALYSLAGATLGISAQDCLALGAVFAATDSVAVLGLLDARSSPQLFSLVFGEGIVNDATSVVLLGALARVARTEAGGGSGDNFLQLGWRLTANFAYLLLSSTCLGVAAGAGVAALLRGRAASQGPHHEVALVGLLSYLTYLAAEVLGLSGILALFCCGATVSHFALRAQPGGSASAGGAGGGALGHGGGTAGVALRSAISDDITTHSAGGGGAAAAAEGAAAPERWEWHVSMDSPRPHDGGSGGAAPSGGAPLASNGVAGGLRLGRPSPPGGDPPGEARGGGGMDLWAAAQPASALAARALRGGGCMTAVGAAATLNAFHSLSYVAEGLIFIYVGMDSLDPVRWQAAYAGEVVWLVGVLLLLLLATRAASVVPLSMLHNLYARSRLSGRDVMVVWWSGLMRGAVSVALVYLNFATEDHYEIARWQPGPEPGSEPESAAPASPGPGGIGHRLLAGSGGGSVEAGVAAAEAEAAEVSARQHATLICATLLVVVASVLTLSTLTKPLLQATLEADARKPPLQVLTEALFDPWVEASWRLRVAFNRSYRRLVENTDGGAAPPRPTEADAPSAPEPAGTRAVGLAALDTAGGGGGGGGGGEGGIRRPQRSASPLSKGQPAGAASAAGVGLEDPEAGTAAAGRQRAQQRGGGGVPRGPAGPSVGAAQLQLRGLREAERAGGESLHARRTTREEAGEGGPQRGLLLADRDGATAAAARAGGAAAAAVLTSNAAPARGLGDL